MVGSPAELDLVHSRAVPDEDDPVGVGGGLRVVGHQDDRLAPLHAGPPELAQDLRPGRVVQVAGRLVGQQEDRARHQSPGEGDPLLLAGGELVGPVALPAGQVDERDGVADPPLDVSTARVHPSDGEREGDVLLDGQEGYEVEGLEDETRLLTPQPRRLAVREATDHVAVEDDLTARGPVQAAEQVEQRALARARRAHEGDELTTSDREGDAAQRLHVGLAEPVAPGQAAGLEDRGPTPIDGCLRGVAP